jgi:membrane associated rhomboid family serine protease
MIFPLGLKSKFKFIPWMSILIGLTLVVSHFLTSTKDRAFEVLSIRSKVLEKKDLLEYSIQQNHQNCVYAVRSELIQKAAKSNFKRSVLKLTSDEYIDQSLKIYETADFDKKNPMAAQNISITCSVLVNYTFGLSTGKDFEVEIVNDSRLDATIRQSAMQYLRTKGKAFLDHEYLILTSEAETLADQEKIAEARNEIFDEVKKMDIPIVQRFDLYSSLKSSFMHNNIGHLLGNLAFFIPHAICIEAVFGPLLFLIFTLISASGIPLLAAFASGDSLSMTPQVLVGFSGTVSFFLGMFLSLFNHRKYNVLYILAVFPILITVPAIVGILTFIASEDFLKAISDRLGLLNSDISFESHLIGLALGIIVASIYKLIKTDFGDSQFKSEIKIFKTLSPELSHEEYAKKVHDILEINPENFTVLDLFFKKIAYSEPTGGALNQYPTATVTLLSSYLAPWLNAASTQNILRQRLLILESFPRNTPLASYLSQCTQQSIQMCLKEAERLKLWYLYFHFLELLLNNFIKIQINKHALLEGLTDLLKSPSPYSNFIAFTHQFPGSSLTRISSNPELRLGERADQLRSLGTADPVDGQENNLGVPPSSAEKILSSFDYRTASSPTTYQHLFAMITDLVVLAPILKLISIIELTISKYFYIYTNEYEIIASVVLGVIGFSYFAFRTEKRLQTIGENACGFQFLNLKKNGVLASPAQLFTRECYRMVILTTIFMLPVLFSSDFGQFLIAASTCSSILLVLNAADFYPWDYFSKVKPISTSNFEPFRLKMR